MSLVRGISFVKLEKPRRCCVCQKICSVNRDMLRQYCACGCGSETYSCMGCPTAEACAYFTGCKKEGKEEVFEEEVFEEEKTIIND